MHDQGCAYILQLAHAGRQRDLQGLDLLRAGLSSTGKSDPLHGFGAAQATVDELRGVVAAFAAGARRAREAGLDGVELHAANGYLFTQFLSSAINDRSDDFGGPLENRARLLLETVRAIRREVGDDFHLQVKLSATENADAFLPWLSAREHDRRLDPASAAGSRKPGVDAIHVSRGSTFPHPDNPAGALPLAEVVHNYDGMISSGVHAFRNFLLYRIWPMNRLMQRRWQRPLDEVEGALLEDARRDPRGGLDSRALHRRVPDRVCHPAGARGRRVRRGHDRPPARREPGPRTALRRGRRPRARGRAPTATSASSTSSRARSAATTSAGSRAARR